MKPNKRFAEEGDGESEMKELFVDNFAGGGGASTGIEMAIGRSVDIAINHDPDAIAMHKANHPASKHYCEDVWQVDPVEACAGKPVALAWFSPDCKHFSRAKGGKPVDKNIRGLAWVAVKWAYAVRPRCIMLENVPEIQTWGPLGADGKPVKERAGETFMGFILALTSGIPATHPAYKEMCDALSVSRTSQMAEALQRGLGYKVQHRTLKSCDYGAPTTRTRFHLIARCDGRPIVWAEPTHAPRDSEAVKAGRKKPYRTVAECIDWSIPAQSIFERKKPLAENTMRRIARGIQKFVIDNPEPFIVTVNHSGEGFRGQDIGEPLHTVTAKHGYGVVTPTIMCNNTNNVGASAEDPLPTVTTGNRNYIVAPSIVPIGYGEREGQDPRANSIEKPLGTVVSSGKHYLVAPTLIQYHDEQGKDEVRGQEVDEPLMTQDTSNRYCFMQLINFESNFEITIAEVARLGAGGKGNKPTGWKGTWSGTAHYNQSVFRKMWLEYKKTGILPTFDIQITNEDPTSSVGRQTVILKNCLSKGGILAKFDADAEILDEDLEGTYDDFEMPEPFSLLSGMKV